jgi:hypothetical protein
MTRNILAMCYIKYIVKDYHMNPYPNQKVLRKLIMRGVFGGSITLAWFSAIKLIPISEATVL